MADRKVIGYVGVKALHSLKEEDIKCLDVVNLAFGKIKDGCIVWNPEDCHIYMEKAKQLNPNIKFLLSIGGWGADGFSEAAASKENREKFAKSALDTVVSGALDGIDIDWEYPCISIAGIETSKDDKENFTLMLKELREQLNQVTDRHCMLTIAAGGDAYYTRCTQMELAQEYLDYVQLMTYDLRGGFSVATGHHTNLYTNAADLNSVSTDYAVKAFIKAGVPREKLVIGVAFYSRIWKGVPDCNHGFLQMAETTGGYGPDYSILIEEYLGKNGFVRYWDDEAKAPYLFNGSEFISYDDKESIHYKAEYVKEKGLGGIMYWEYNGDETYTLTSWIAEQLK